MQPRPLVRSVRLLCFACTLACSPSTPEVRPTPRDSGHSPHIGCDDAASARATDAARPDAHDDRTPDFRLVLLDPALAVAPGTTAPLRVRIERIGGFGAPVLIDLWGLPNTVSAQARESRASDDVIEVMVEASDDAEPVEDSPFAVQASALGIRHVARTTLSVR